MSALAAILFLQTPLDRFPNPIGSERTAEPSDASYVGFCCSMQLALSFGIISEFGRVLLQPRARGLFQDS